MTVAQVPAARSLDAAIDHLGQAIVAGADEVALGKLLAAATLLESIDADQATDHPLLEEADGFLATAGDRATGDCQFHVRQARQYCWLLGGDPA